VDDRVKRWAEKIRYTSVEVKCSVHCEARVEPYGAGDECDALEVELLIMEGATGS
jgi:hypothetical protein